ncbi:MAG: DUF2784 domain-containing protein [bacterium]
MYELLDTFFFLFHTSVILFNLFGWLWRKTRKANLILLSLTALSWFGLGIWYGIGYCPCTDWHWQVRRKLGLQDMPNSYIKFLVDNATGLDVDAELVDVLTASLFFCAVLASVHANLRDWKRSRQR